jgi:hypothetical protein
MEEIILVNQPLSRQQLRELAAQGFGEMVKGVVDVEREVMALGGELHADSEAFLLKQGSLQRDLWGINLYPDMELPEMLEFDSMINIRPSQNNRSRSVENPVLQEKIRTIVKRMIL